MNADWISAVEFIGKVLIIIPIITGLPLILYSAFTGVKVDFSAATSAPSLMITSGLIMIFYSAIKKFKAARQK